MTCTDSDHVDCTPEMHEPTDDDLDAISTWTRAGYERMWAKYETEQAEQRASLIRFVYKNECHYAAMAQRDALGRRVNSCY